MCLSLYRFLLSLCKNFPRDLSSFLVAAAVLILFVCLFVCFWLCWVIAAVQRFSSCGGRGLHSQLQSADLRASVVAMWQLSSCGSWALEHSSVAVAHRLSCSVACGILPDQGSDPGVLHWQANSFEPPGMLSSSSYSGLT